MFDEYGVDNCKIELLEAYPCNSIDEIRQREAHYIKTIPNINNHHNWTQERIEEKKQKERKQAHEFYENNKEELNDIIWQLEGVLYNRREAKNLEVIGLPNGFNWNVEQSQGPAYMVSLTDIGNGEISRDLQYRLIITGNANNDSVPGVYEFTINLKDQFDNISATTKGSFEIINDEETTQVEESPE